MKIWFEYCGLNGYLSDDAADVKFGIGWYKHSENHKWRGLTIQLYLFPWLVSINFVNNWVEYDKRINRKYDPDYIKKLGERLRAKRAQRDKK